MKGAGTALTVLGALLAGGAMLYEPTVSAGGSEYGAPSQVYNLGALQFQELLFLAGCTSFLAGIILLSVGELADRMERAGTAKAPDAVASSVSSLSQCAWCDRDMTPYRACSAASDEANRERAGRVTDPTCLARFEERGLLANSAPNPG